MPTSASCSSLHGIKIRKTLLFHPWARRVRTKRNADKAIYHHLHQPQKRQQQTGGFTAISYSSILYSACMHALGETTNCRASGNVRSPLLNSIPTSHRSVLLSWAVFSSSHSPLACVCVHSSKITSQLKHPHQSRHIVDRFMTISRNITPRTASVSHRNP